MDVLRTDHSAINGVEWYAQTLKDALQTQCAVLRMLTGDKKGVTYDNIVRKRSWSNRSEAVQTLAKPDLAVRKVLLCIWWDWKGIIYYELLPYGQTLNSDICFQQLDRWMLAVDQNRPTEVVLCSIRIPPGHTRQ
ncbi:putative DD34D transposase [Trichonephila clavipes]|nr:putative DD34D transposase [Trichonephila clavipes]